MAVLLLAEHDNKSLAPATAKAPTAARAFGSDVDILIVGQERRRGAAMLDVAQISDIVKVKSPKIFVRPVYAGNALETVETSDKIVVGTVRTTAFASAGDSGPGPTTGTPPPR